MNSITFDIETRKLADEVGGWGALKSGEGGASAIVLWSTAANRPFLFDDNTIPEVIHQLEHTDLVLSFNGVGFDIPILEGLYGRKLRIHHHLDLLQLIWEALSDRSGSHKGNSLDAVSARTLNKHKTGKGEHAPALAERGQWGELFNYCLDDVCLTRELFQFAQEHGGIIGVDGELLHLDLPPWFKEASI